MRRRVINLAPSVKASTCQYIAADKDYERLRSQGKLFCGAKTIDNSSYCDKHHWKLFTMPSMKMKDVA